MASKVPKFQMEPDTAMGKKGVLFAAFF